MARWAGGWVVRCLAQKTANVTRPCPVARPSPLPIPICPHAFSNPTLTNPSLSFQPPPPPLSLSRLQLSSSEFFPSPALSVFMPIHASLSSRQRRGATS